jgi:hypothetical protein
MSKIYIVQGKNTYKRKPLDKSCMLVMQSKVWKELPLILWFLS